MSNGKGEEERENKNLEEEDKDKFGLQRPGDRSPTLHITMQEFKV